MALSKQYALDQIHQALGRGTSRRVDDLDILNQAGEHFYGVREWQHARRGSALLDYVAGEKAIALPEDFGSYMALTAASGLVRGFELVTAGELDLYEAGTLGTNWVTWGAFVGNTETDGSVSEKLEIYPTPDANETGALILRYRAGWVNVLAGTKLLAVPDFCRGLYLAYVRAFARGLERQDAGSLTQNLNEVDTGALLARAARQDSAKQRIVGRLSNGAMNAVRPYRTPFPPLEGPSGS